MNVASCRMSTTFLFTLSCHWHSINGLDCVVNLRTYDISVLMNTKLSNPISIMNQRFTQPHGSQMLLFVSPRLVAWHTNTSLCAPLCLQACWFIILYRMSDHQKLLDDEITPRPPRHCGYPPCLQQGPNLLVCGGCKLEYYCASAVYSLRIMIFANHEESARMLHAKSSIVPIMVLNAV
jgi:hypothetical protein